MTIIFLAVVIIGASILYALVGVSFVRRRMHGHVLEGHNEVLAPLFLTAGTIYAVLLGFLVIVVWEAYGSAKANIADEASVLTTMYRQTNGMPSAEQTTMRRLLREYTEAVIGSEWQLQVSGEASPTARKALADIYQTFSGLNSVVAASPINAEFLHEMSVVAEERNRRVLASGEQLPWVLWVGLILGGLIVVGMSFILYMESIWPHVLMSSVLAGLIGTFLFVTIVLNQPFSGPLGLDSGPFEHSLSVYDSVDQGN